MELTVEKVIEMLMANPNHRIFYPTKSIGITIDENSPEYIRIKGLQENSQKWVDELNKQLENERLITQANAPSNGEEVRDNQT